MTSCMVEQRRIMTYAAPTPHASVHPAIPYDPAVEQIEALCSREEGAALWRSGHVHPISWPDLTCVVDALPVGHARSEVGIRAL